MKLNPQTNQITGTLASLRLGAMEAPDSNKQPFILLPANSNQPTPTGEMNLVHLLMQGGAAVGVILGMTIFAKILLEAITKLAREMSDKHK